VIAAILVFAQSSRRQQTHRDGRAAINAGFVAVADLPNRVELLAPLEHELELLNHDIQSAANHLQGISPL
jgi:hypothetical protein